MATFTEDELCEHGKIFHYCKCPKDCIADHRYTEAHITIIYENLGN